MAKAVLGAKGQEDFAAAVAGIPPAEEAPVVETPPAEGEPPTPPAQEVPPVSETPPVETPAVEEPAAAEEEIVEGQRVPYDRFKKVNDARKTLEEKQADYERRLANVDSDARTQAAAYLENIAAQNPQLKDAIYGRTPPAAAPESEELPAVGTIERQVHDLTVQNQELAARQTRSEEARHLDEIEGRADTQMAQDKVFTNPVVRKAAEEMIAQRMVTNPRMPVEQIVKDVGALFRGLEEGHKKQYLAAKATVARTVPVGVGPGAAAPPGQPPVKLNLNDGSALRALAGAMKQGV